MANYCMKCGAPLPPGAKYCMKCGQPVSGTAQGKPVFSEPDKAVKPNRKRSGNLLVIVIVLCLAVFGVFRIKGCTDEGKNEYQPETVHDPSGSTEQQTQSSSTIAYGNGFITGTTVTDQKSPDAEKVRVVLNSYTFDEEEDVRVQCRPLNIEENSTEGYKLLPYEISLGDKHQLNSFVSVYLPYGSGFCAQGETEEECVGALFFNEETGEWEDAIYEVLPDSHEVRILTDHFSKFALIETIDRYTREKLSLQMDSLMKNLTFEKVEQAVRSGVTGGEADVKSIGIITTIAETGHLAFNAQKDTLSWISNINTMITMGQPWPNPGTTLYMNKLAERGFLFSTVAVADKLVREYYKLAAGKGNDRNTILNLYKDAALLAADYASVIKGVTSSAFNVAFSGVFIFNYVISEMFSEVERIRLSELGEIYEYFQDTYKEGEYKPRTNKEWYELFIQISEENKGNEKAIQQKIDDEMKKYAERFWNIPLTVLSSAASDIGYRRTTWPMPEEQQKLTAEYLHNLRIRLSPIVYGVERYYLYIQYRDCFRALRDIQKQFRKPITLTITDRTEEKQYAGCRFRFVNVSEHAPKAQWEGELDKNGTYKGSFTMNDYILAGFPVSAAVYKTKEDTENGKPLYTGDLDITAENTEASVDLGGYDDDILFENTNMRLTSVVANNGFTSADYYPQEPYYSTFRIYKKDNAFEMVTPHSEVHRLPKDSIYRHMREIPSFELDGFMEKHTVYDSTETVEGTIGSVEPYTVTSYTRIKKTDELTQIDYAEWQVESAEFKLKIKNNPDRPADMELRVTLNGYYSHRRLDPSDGREFTVSKKTSDAYMQLIFVSE